MYPGRGYVSMVERIELGLEMAEQIRSHEVVRDHLIGWGSWVHRFLRLGVTFLRPSSPLVYAPHAVDHDEDNDDDDDDDYDGGDDDDDDGDEVVGAERKARVACRDKNLGRIPDPISPQLTIAPLEERILSGILEILSRASRPDFPTFARANLSNLIISTICSEVYAPVRIWFRQLRNIRYNNSRYQVPLITLNPQPRHTPCSLNFRVILICRQLPSASSSIALLFSSFRPSIPSIFTPLRSSLPSFLPSSPSMYLSCLDNLFSKREKPGWILEARNRLAVVRFFATPSYACPPFSTFPLGINNRQGCKFFHGSTGYERARTATRMEEALTTRSGNDAR